MDPVWEQLPSDLVYHICNQLPKVRKLPDDLKARIENKTWMVDRMLKYYTMWFGRYDAYWILLDDLNMLNESEFNDIYEVWKNTNDENRAAYYTAVLD